MATVRNEEAVCLYTADLCPVWCYIGDFKRVCTPKRTVELDLALISPCSSPNYSRCFLSKRETVRADSTPSVCSM